MVSLNILHATPQTLARAGLKTILADSEEIEKIDKAETAEELLERIDTSQYDLVVVDYDAHSSFSGDEISNIQKIAPFTKILVVFSEKKQHEINKILESGVSGCITKACSEGEIRQAVLAVIKGEQFFCNKVIDLVLQEHLYRKGNKIAGNCEPTHLSPREIEITRLIAEGLTNKQIAEKLYLSIHTIHTHRKNIMKKLGIKSASELVRYAISVGIIQTG